MTVEDGEPIPQNWLLNTPGGDTLIDPTPEKVHDALAGLTPADWEEGDAGLLSPDADLILLFAPGHGYFLNLQRKEHPTIFLVARELDDSPEYVEVEAGYQYTVREDYFVPFETLWQAVFYFLEHGEPHPGLRWTEASPYSDAA